MIWNAACIETLARLAHSPAGANLTMLIKIRGCKQGADEEERVQAKHTGFCFFDSETAYEQIISPPLL